MSEKKSKAPLIAAAAVAFASLASATPAQAALLVYEGFGYADGTSIRTQTGGTGWLDLWQNTGAATEIATAPGLTYQTLATTGNKLSIAGQQTTGNGNNAFILRNLTTTYGTDGTTLWLSFIGQRTGSKGPVAAPTNYQRVFTLGLFNVGTEQASVGELSNDLSDTWKLSPDTTAANSQNTGVAIDAQAFLLLKITYGVGTGAVDTGQLWVNPNLGLGELGLGAAQATITDDLTFSRIRLTVGGSQTTGPALAASGLMDEIRIGETFVDVAPVPEPASLALLAVGAGSMVARRRRRV